MRALILVLFCLAAIPALAERIELVTFEFPPLEYEGRDGQPKGIAVEVVTTVMERLGYEVEIKVLPWALALDRVKDGKADAIFTAYKNEERMTFLDYSRRVLAPQRVHFYTRVDFPETFTGEMALFDGRRVGVVSTISYGQIFDQYRENYHIERVRTLESNIHKLLRNRIDVFPSNYYVAERALSRLGLSDRVRRHEQAIESVPSYIAFSKKRRLTQLRDAFDRELELFSQYPEYEEIFARYGISPPERLTDEGVVSHHP